MLYNVIGCNGINYKLADAFLFSTQTRPNQLDLPVVQYPEYRPKWRKGTDRYFEQ